MAVEKIININVDVDDKELKNLNQTLDKTQKEVQDTTKATSTMGNALDRATGGAITKFKGMITDVKNLALGFKGLRVAIIATGIGALLIAITTLGALFTKTQRGADLLSKAMAAIGAAVSVVIDRMSKIGEAFGLLLSGDLSGAFNTTKEAVSGLTDEIIRETMAAWNLQDALNAVRDAENGLIVTNAKRRQEIAKNRLIAEDETIAIDKRIEALDNATRIEGEILADQIKIAKEKARIVKEEVALGESLDEDIKRREEAAAAVIDLETQSLNFQKSIITRRNALIRQGAAKAKADAEEARRAKEDAPRGGESVVSELSPAQLTEIATAQITSDAILEINQKRADKQKIIEQGVANAKVDIAKQTLALIGAIAGEGSAIGKGVAVAQATISGIEGVQNAYSTAQKSPITLGFPAYPLIQAGLAGAFSAVQIAKILSVDPSGKSKSNVGRSGGGGGGASAPSFNVVGTSGVNQLAESLQQDQQPVQAYVVGSNVTSQQELDRNIVDQVSLG